MGTTLSTLITNPPPQQNPPPQAPPPTIPTQPPVPQQQPPTHALRNGKAYTSFQAPSNLPSHVPAKKPRTAAQIAAQKKTQATKLAKKHARAATLAKRQATLAANIKAAAAAPKRFQEYAGAVNSIAVESFAQRWVDEQGREVGLDAGEVSEIREILKRTNENWTPVLRIQRIYNEVLEGRFLERREEMRRAGKKDEQVLVFHGTQPQNVVPYFLFLW
jgi:hypothetical protein